LRLDYDLSNGKNLLTVERNLEKFKNIIEIKKKILNGFTENSFYEEDLCFNEINFLKNKKNSLAQNLSNLNKERYLSSSFIEKKKIHLDINNFIKHHFIIKSEFFKKIAKNFYENKYILIPIFEDLLDFARLIKVYSYSIKNISSDGNKLEILFLELFENINFKKINDSLNIFEKETLNEYILLLKKAKFDKNIYIQNNFKIIQENIFDFSKKCIQYNLDPKLINLIKVNDFNLELKNNNQKTKKIVYCSNNIILLKYFLLKIFDRENRFISKIDDIIKLIKAIAESLNKKIIFINEEFNFITQNVSGSKSYFENQINLYLSKEKTFKNEIEILENNFIDMNPEIEYEKEYMYLENIISVKNQICLNKGILYDLSKNYLKKI